MSRMALSLSVRVAESFSDKRRASMTMNEIVGLAKIHGYSAICVRASLAGIETPQEDVKDMALMIQQAGLAVSMVTGDFAVPQNGDDGSLCLRNITPYLDLAETLGTSLIRVCLKKEVDIGWAQRACDEARERNICLAHQSHIASLFETVDGSVAVLERLGRSNFGLIYEPANWMIVGEEYGSETIQRLQSRIFNVYVQNHRLNPKGTEGLPTWTQGVVHVDHIGIWQAGGVDFDRVFEALHQVGYCGFVTVHQAFEGVMSVEDAVSKSQSYLASRI